MSFHEDMPCKIINVYRDDEFIQKLEDLVTEFITKMLKKREELEKYK